MTQKKTQALEKVESKAPPPVDEEKITELLDNDHELILFFNAWIRNGRNATRAYKELNPHVNDHAARVLGSRVLAKVDKRAVMAAYGLDDALYFKQLRKGVVAKKGGEPDHSTRRLYHKPLGEILGHEGQKNSGPPGAFQVGNIINNWATPQQNDAT